MPTIPQLFQLFHNCSNRQSVIIPPMEATKSDKKYTNVTSSWLNMPRITAAYLVAVGTLSDTKIAQFVGISRMQLHRWKKRIEFILEVEGFRDEIRRELEAAFQHRVEQRQDQLIKLLEQNRALDLEAINRKIEAIEQMEQQEQQGEEKPGDDEK
jgi:CII protein